MTGKTYQGRPVSFRCDYCGEAATHGAGHVKRSRSQGAGLYCSRECSGLARRTWHTDETKKAQKAAYDRQRREELGDELRAQKRAAYWRDHEKRLEEGFALRATPEWKAAHAAYVKTPRYREWKRAYDERRRDAEFGEFAEAKRAQINLDKEIRARVDVTAKELHQDPERFSKTQRRKRACQE